MSTALILSGGGPLAVAWECGLLAGLARAGMTFGPVDFILGTSAGAIVGAQLAAGRPPESMAEAILREVDGVPPPGAMPSYPIAAVLKLPELFASSQSSRRRRIEAGSYAMSAPMIETEAAYVERIEAAIGIEVWPRQDIGLVATDAASGTACVLNRECGATIAAAVAASCCLPGLSPPVAIGGRHYMDGGMRSAANADLARGFDSILVLCFHPPGPPGARVLARVSAQSEVLIGGGASVSVIAPDAASLAAIGPRTMDLVRRPAVARAGLELGEHSADLIERFWGKTGQPLR